MALYGTLLRLSLVFLRVGLGTCTDCRKRDPCSCELTDGSGTIDLTSLGNTDGTPRFKDVACGADDNFYSYNPCGGFDEERGCMDAALCTLNEDKTMVQQLGKAAETKFKYDEDSGHVVAGYIYHAVSLGYSEVEMICDESACEQPVFVPLGLSEASYKMQLRSICACAGKCTSNGPGKCAPTTGQSPGGLSVGSFILIGLAGILVLYLVVGVMFMKIGKKKTGTDLIPNKELWVAAPRLVTGGFKFLFSKCASRRSGYTESK